jgi:hypothetical protein
VSYKEDIEVKVKHTVCPYTHATPSTMSLLCCRSATPSSRPLNERNELAKKSNDCKTFSGHFSVRRPHSHHSGHASAVPGAAAAAAHVLNDPRRRTMAGGSGKKTRGRASKANKKKGEAAKPPPPPPPPPAAVPSSSSDEPPEQQVPRPEEATAAPSHASDRVALVNRLCTFAQNTKDVLHSDVLSWVASELSECSGVWAALAAAAEGGDAKAKYIMGFSPHISAEETGDWAQRALDQGHLDAHLHFGVIVQLYRRAAYPNLRF